MEMALGALGYRTWKENEMTECLSRIVLSALGSVLGALITLAFLLWKIGKDNETL